MVVRAQLADGRIRIRPSVDPGGSRSSKPPGELTTQSAHLEMRKEGGVLEVRISAGAHREQLHIASWKGRTSFFVCVVLREHVHNAKNQNDHDAKETKTDHFEVILRVRRLVLGRFLHDGLGWFPGQLHGNDLRYMNIYIYIYVCVCVCVCTMGKGVALIFV